MIIQVNNTEFELSTKLRTAMAIEKRFKLPISAVFQKVGEAEIEELADILCAAVDTEHGKILKASLMENWDYLDLQYAVQEVLARIMFSGTTEENEKKMEKFPATEQQKNQLRKLLGLATRKELPNSAV